MKEKDRHAPLTRRDVKVPKELQPSESTPVGTAVRVYRDNGLILTTRTRSNVWRYLDGKLVVSVDGLSGGQVLDTVEVLDEHTAGGAE